MTTLEALPSQVSNRRSPGVGEFFPPCRELFPGRLPLSATDAADEERMPKTASPLALLALLGGAGVGSAFGLRRLRRR